MQTVIPFWDNGVSRLYQADARALPLPDASVHCCVTSPPYWGLRDYGLGDWEGGDPDCGHSQWKKSWADPAAKSTLTRGRKPASSGNSLEGWPGCVCGHCGATQTAEGIGLEPTLADWVDSIVAVGCEVWRVLRDDGTWWLNLGDSYSNSSSRRDWTEKNFHMAGNGAGHKRPPQTLPAKNLLGQPWRAAFALQDDGWVLRSAIVWHKPNPMPEAVTDRPTSSYEMLYLLAKRGRYYYDAEAIKMADTSNEFHRTGKKSGGNKNRNDGDSESKPGYAGANARNVWTINTQGRPDAHFATYPDELPRRCILAGTSEHGVCGECGAPWMRLVEREAATPREKPGEKVRHNYDRNDGERGGNWLNAKSAFLGWQPTCAHADAPVVPAVVLDPFIGSGTTAAVAQSLGRRAVGVDLNPEYLEIARRRIEAVPLPLRM